MVIRVQQHSQFKSTPLGNQQSRKVGFHSVYKVAQHVRENGFTRDEIIKAIKATTQFDLTNATQRPAQYGAELYPIHNNVHLTINYVYPGFYVGYTYIETKDKHRTAFTYTKSNILGNLLMLDNSESVIKEIFPKHFD